MKQQNVLFPRKINFTAQKEKFSINLVTFTVEEILNGKLHFFVQCLIFNHHLRQFWFILGYDSNDKL